ncbi:hypothetical protein MHAS_00039 [Mycolicibacterium hassiacum DSM 44199]|nr:hypothetical protein [Mycolicibacterium hassiacum DSM 44199]VCT88359.1 hypothetical protein MHAS_00039 [Mycolicibacterium hassiacum DSM 44199]
MVDTGSDGLVRPTSASPRHHRPLRMTLASELHGELDGAWWPYTASMAHELSDLTDALREPLGEIVSIDVNWSPFEAAPNLDSVISPGTHPMPGQRQRPMRIMRVNGTRGHAHLLVIPSRTSRAVALMVLRQAARLPVHPTHQGTEAYQTAGTIVAAARKQTTTH